MLSKKDLIAINEQFSTGSVVNSSSLDFVINQTKRSNNWYKTMCLISRAIIVDHIFEDGNKRTATAVIIAYLDAHDYSYNPDLIAKTVLRIAKYNITDTNKIGRLLKNALT